MGGSAEGQGAGVQDVLAADADGQGPREDRVQVGGGLQVPPVVQIVQAGPVGDDPAAVQAAAQHQGAGGGAVVGSARAVRGSGAAELGHDQHGGSGPGVSQLLREGGQALTEPA